MSFIDLPMLEIGLGDGPFARFGISVFVSIEDEPTNGCPLQPVQAPGG